MVSTISSILWLFTRKSTSPTCSMTSRASKILLQRRRRRQEEELKQVPEEQQVLAMKSFQLWRASRKSSARREWRRGRKQPRCSTLTTSIKTWNLIQINAKIRKGKLEDVILRIWCSRSVSIGKKKKAMINCASPSSQVILKFKAAQ